MRLKNNSTAFDFDLIFNFDVRKQVIDPLKNLLL